MREMIELHPVAAPHPNPLPAGGERGRALLGAREKRRSRGISLLPVMTGRRWRQPDEGQPRPAMTGRKADV